MKKYDYVIVGAGLFGSVFAREATKHGKQVLVVDKRDHIGGNCYTKTIDGINVHMYSTHVFHTAKKELYDYITQFADFNNFSLRIKANYQGSLYSMPINLMTMHQIWGVTTPEEAEAKLKEVRVPCENPRNLEEWVLSQIGQELYEKFIYGYTRKQWNKEPSELPASIIKRIPVRIHSNDRWYPDKDRWEGVPIGGYTPIFQKMLAGSEVQLNVDFNKERALLENMAEKVIYSGPIDELFDCKLGRLEYRSLDLVHKITNGDFQGMAQVNYTEASVPYTRIIEHKHFEFEQDNPKTVITYEYPKEYTEGDSIPFYSVNDLKNTELYTKYKEMIDPAKYLVGGRLGRYQYYNMDQTIANALVVARDELR